MSTTTPVALILGVGPRIGTGVAQAFLKKGYAVAVASRRATPVTGTTPFQVDLTQPSSVPALFAAVTSALHAAPSVVVYNAAALTPPPEKDLPLSISADSVLADLNVNTVSAYVAAQEALKGWETLPAGTKTSFIYTGNIMNTEIISIPMYFNLGMGKCASAYWIGVADELYKAKGHRFFYADERFADGRSKGPKIDGDVHGEFFVHLADQPVSVPWHATFAEGKGYIKF